MLDDGCTSPLSTLVQLMVNSTSAWNGKITIKSLWLTQTTIWKCGTLETHSWDRNGESIEVLKIEKTWGMNLSSSTTFVWLKANRFVTKMWNKKFWLWPTLHQYFTFNLNFRHDGFQLYGKPDVGIINFSSSMELLAFFKDKNNFERLRFQDKLGEILKWNLWFLQISDAFESTLVWSQPRRPTSKHDSPF